MKRREWLVIARTLAPAGVAWAGDMFNHTRHYRTKVGQEVRIGVTAHFNRRCQPTSSPNIFVTQAPQHGGITTRPGSHKVKETIGSSSCDWREVADIQVIYTPAQGFVGADKIVYTVTLAGEDVMTNTVTVDVN